RILLNDMQRLEANGNTLVVVEHDEDTIRQAQHIIDMGPGAGTRGGRVVAEGTVEDILANPNSLTGQYLRQRIRHPLRGERRAVDAADRKLTVIKADKHNLQQLTAHIPINRLSVITGVSGSGKSTFAREVVLDNLLRVLHQKDQSGWQGCERI